MKKLFATILGIALLLSPLTVFGAIALDNSTTGALGSGTSQTLSYTTAGSNRILAVYTFKQGGVTCTGVTYAGVAMTRIGTTQNVGSEVEDLWLLVNPASGTNNIIASFSGIGATSGITAVSFTGASQTGQPDSVNQNITTSVTSASLTLTTIANNSWIVGFSRDTGGIQAAGTNTTQVANVAGPAFSMMYSPTAQTPAGSHSVTMTDIVSGDFYMTAFSFSPFVPPSVSPFNPFILFFGAWARL